MVAAFNSMSDFEAAGIIDRVFPKHPFLCKPETDVSVIDLMDALIIAKKKCASYKLYDCINWSRGIIYKK